MPEAPPWTSSVSGLEATALEQVDPDGHEGFRQRRRFLHAQAVGQVQGGALVGHRELRVAAAGNQRHHRLADGEAADLLPTARTVPAISRPGMSEAPGGGSYTPCAEARRDVDAGGADFDQDLARAGRRQRPAGRHQYLGAAGPGDLDGGHSFGKSVRAAHRMLLGKWFGPGSHGKQRGCRGRAALFIRLMRKCIRKTAMNWDDTRVFLALCREHTARRRPRASRRPGHGGPAAGVAGGGAGLDPVPAHLVRLPADPGRRGGLELAEKMERSALSCCGGPAGWTTDCPARCGCPPPTPWPSTCATRPGPPAP